MTDVDRLDLLAQELGFVLKSKQREALELLLRGNASLFAVSKKTLVEGCKINSITNQILQIISEKQRKRKEEICAINSKARKAGLFNETCERS